MPRKWDSYQCAESHVEVSAKLIEFLSQMSVSVTGSLGLVGMPLCANLGARGFHVVGTVRS